MWRSSDVRQAPSIVFDDDESVPAARVAKDVGT